MKKNNKTQILIKNQLHKDFDILKFYYNNQNWDLLDSKLYEILKCGDINRQRMALTIFKSFQNNRMFEGILDKLIKNIEIKTEYKV